MCFSADVSSTVICGGLEICVCVIHLAKLDVCTKGSCEARSRDESFPHCPFSMAGKEMDRVAKNNRKKGFKMHCW